MNQLRSCGEQYRLARIEKVVQRPSTPAVAGKIIHLATEHVDQIFHGGSTSDRESLADVGMDCVKDQAGTMIQEEVASSGFQTSEWIRYGRATNAKPRGEDIEWFLREGIPTAIYAYVDWRLSRPDLELVEIPGFGPAIEVPFNYYIGGQLIVGYIDRVFTDGVGKFPVDLKSGRKPATDEQLGLYAAALHEGLQWEPSWGFYVYGLKTGEAKITPPVDLRHWTKDKLARVYLAATRLIEDGIFIPHPGDSCQHCGVADACSFVSSLV